ncbi:MAG TPA: hypothetical protein VIY47_02880, partial [Ignavibacteriaceae bacterium]
LQQDILLKTMPRKEAHLRLFRERQLVTGNNDLLPVDLEERIPKGLKIPVVCIIKKEKGSLVNEPFSFL